MNKEAEILFYKGKIEFLIQKCHEFQTDDVEEQEDLKEIINTLNAISLSLNSWENVDIDTTEKEKADLGTDKSNIYVTLLQQLT